MIQFTVHAAVSFTNGQNIKNFTILRFFLNFSKISSEMIFHLEKLPKRGGNMEIGQKLPLNTYW